MSLFKDWKFWVTALTIIGGVTYHLAQKSGADKKISDLTLDKNHLAFELMQEKAKTKTVYGVGEYTTDTIYVDKEIVIPSTTSAPETIMVRVPNRVDVILLDTTSTFTWENHLIKVHAEGRFHSDSQYADSNYFRFFPILWQGPRPEVIYQGSPKTSRFGLGIQMVNLSVGPFARYKKFQFALMKDVNQHGWKVGMAYEVFSF